MDVMFYGATAFNQNEGNWNLAGLQSAGNMFDGSGLSCIDYDSILVGWENNVSTPSNIDFSGETGIIYSSVAAVTARNTLISSKSWTIDGDTLIATCDLSVPLP